MAAYQGVLNNPKPVSPHLVHRKLAGVGGVLGLWTIVTITRPKKVTISGLTLAGIYQFQIRALGVFGYTDWLDPKTFVIA